MNQPYHDPNLDALFHRTVAAFHGDTETWKRVNRALRDAMVDHARERSPYYRRRIRPGMPFDEIPLLTKALIREHHDELIAEGIPESRRFPDRTSGSTAEPMRFLRDTSQGPAESVATDRFFRRLWRIPDEAINVSVTTRPVPRRWWGAFVDDGRIGRVGGGFPPRPIVPVPLRHLTLDRIPRTLARWQRHAPYFVQAFPSVLDRLAWEIERRSLSIPEPPSAVVAFAETLTQPAFERIGRAFGAPVFARYSLNEVSRPAGTLPGTRRYAMSPLVHHVELLDEDGRPVGPGETGRIVITDLNNHVMPFLRYDTGDLAVASREGYVGGFLLVDEVLGRAAELLQLPSGRMITASTLQTAFTRTADLQPEIRTYQCAQTAPNALELRIVWTREPSEEVRRLAIESLRQAADPDTEITIRDVEQLDRLPSGKGWIVRREL
jgi:phenylacetate-CoA ligase